MCHRQGNNEIGLPEYEFMREENEKENINIYWQTWHWARRYKVRANKNVQLTQNQAKLICWYDHDNT